MSRNTNVSAPSSSQPQIKKQTSSALKSALSMDRDVRDTDVFNGNSISTGDAAYDAGLRALQKLEKSALQAHNKIIRTNYKLSNRKIISQKIDKGAQK